MPLAVDALTAVYFRSGLEDLWKTESRVINTLRMHQRWFSLLVRGLCIPLKAYRRRQTPDRVFTENGILFLVTRHEGKSSS